MCRSVEWMWYIYCFTLGNTTVTQSTFTALKDVSTASPHKAGLWLCILKGSNWMMFYFTILFSHRSNQANLQCCILTSIFSLTFLYMYDVFPPFIRLANATCGYVWEAQARLQLASVLLFILAADITKIDIRVLTSLSRLGRSERTLLNQTFKSQQIKTSGRSSFYT